MKVFDRYAGHPVDLPRDIEPGRFRLLADAALGADLRQAIGQPIVGATWHDLPLDDGAVVRAIGQAGMAAGQFDLIELAVSSLARVSETEHVSPLMPASVGELAELGELERVLAERIVHLQEINQRPRMGMQYETEVAALSRVRKMAPNAIAHLAVHSEDWHRRTLLGIAPKRLLGLFSEDELAIYENKVYVRLLDKLDQHLKRRCDTIERLHKQCREALDLGGPEDLDYRLRNDLYALWGAAFSIDETQQLLDASNDALHMLVSLRRQVSVLRNGTLYAAVPPSLRVPEQLRDTNILQHDQHYRHLRTLWRLHQQRPLGKPLTLRQAVDRNLALFEDYVVYIGRLCHRVLRECRVLVRANGQCHFAGRAVHVARDSDAWRLVCGDADLVLVPTFLACVVPDADASSQERRILVAMLATGEQAMAAPDPDSRCICVNPLDFHGLEKIRMVVDAFLWRGAVSRYGQPLGKLPGALHSWLGDKGLTRGKSSGGTAMLQPVASDDAPAFAAWLQNNALNEQTRTALRHAADNLQALSSCRECGKRATFEPTPIGFRVRCAACASTLQLRVEHGKRVAELSIDSAAPRTFHAQGARYLRFALTP